MKKTTSENLLHSEIIEEFEVDGKPARVIILEMPDIDKNDLAEHANNLADTNFQLLKNIPNAEKRAAVRSVMFGIRQRLEKLPIIGGKIRDSKKIDTLLGKVYPDYTYNEHLTLYRDSSFVRYTNKRQMLAVEMDGRIVSIQAYNKIGKTQSGRSVYEFTKASTLNDPRYRGKRLNPRLKKDIFKTVMQKDPEAIWVGATVNKKHLNKLKSRGWHVSEIDDPHEAVQVLYNMDPDYLKQMKEQGYKAVYLDPKVDQVKWE